MNNVFKVFFYARKNYVNKDGEVGIMVRIALNGQKTQFSSKQTICLEMWDATENSAVGRSEQGKEFSSNNNCSVRLLS